MHGGPQSERQLEAPVRSEIPSFDRSSFLRLSDMEGRSCKDAGSDDVVDHSPPETEETLCT